MVQCADGTGYTCHVDQMVVMIVFIALFRMGSVCSTPKCYLNDPETSR